MKNILFSKIFRRFLFSYILILILPILAFFFAYFSAINSIEESAKKYHLAMIEQAQVSLETQLNEIRLLSTQMSRDPIINDYMYSLEKDRSNTYQVWNVQKKLSEYLSTNNLISQIYVSSQKNKSIISTTYYHKDTNQSNNMSYNNSNRITLTPIFNYTLNDIYSTKIIDDKIDQNTLMYVRSFPEGVPNTSYGNICIVLDESKLLELMSFSNDWTGGFTIILDDNNSILVASGKEPERLKNVAVSFDNPDDSISITMNDENMIMTYKKSQYMGWIYISAYSERQVLAGMLHVKRAIVACLILTIVLGFFMAYILSIRNTGPIRNMMKVLNDVTIGQEYLNKNEYIILESALSELVHENKNLLEKRAGHKKLVKEAFFHVFMNGNKKNTHLISQISQEVGIEIDNCSFVGVQFEVEQNINNKSLRNKDEIYNNISSYFFEYIGEKNIAFFVGDSSKFVLLFFQIEEKLSMFGKLQDIIKKIKEGEIHNDYKCLMGISDVHNINNLGNCSEEAQFALEYSKIFEFGRILLYDSIEVNLHKSKFTLKDYQRLLNVLKLGDPSSAQMAYNDMIEDKIVESKINVSIGEQLFYAIKGMLFEGLDFIENHELKEKIEDTKFSEDNIFNCLLKLEEFYISIAIEIEKKKEIKGSVLIQEVIEYLKREYANSNISISSVSDRFNVSEAYLTKLFKETTNETIAWKLESIRIERVKQFLLTSDLNMNQIAKASGYNSPESFRRAFKRNVGVTPSSYRLNNNTK